MIEKLDAFLPGESADSLKNFPFFWILQVSSGYSQMMERSLKPLRIDNTKRRIILSAHALHHASITEIACMSNLKLTTATKAVYKLVDEGVLQVGPGSKDERLSIVRLTAKGEDLVGEINQVSKTVLTGVFAQLTEDELNNLNLTLKKISQLLPFSP